METPTDLADQLDESQREQIEERIRPSTLVIFETIRREGAEELERDAAALGWSGLAAGLSMTLGLLAMGGLSVWAPPGPWHRLVVGLGYPLGYVIVILGRQQLFTENTLTPLLAILPKPSPRYVWRGVRLWAIVLATNLVGALIGAAILRYGQPLEPAAVAPMAQLGTAALHNSWITNFVKAMFAGWLIALIVWLLPLAETSGLFVIFGITYVVGIAPLVHIVATSGEIFYAAFLGRAAWAAYPAFFGATFLGNAFGGVAFVSLLSFAQIASDGSESRKQPADKQKRTK